MSPSQIDMLRLVNRWSGRAELGEVVMEEATRYDGGLAWRIADRTAGALLRRGLIAAEDGVVQITDAGRAVLESQKVRS